MLPAPVGQTDEAARRQREEAVFNPARFLTGYIQEMHGNKQTLYNKESLRIVYQAVQALKESVKSQEDLTTTWKNLLEKLAKERHTLAVAQGALNADYFGQWMDRDGEDTFFSTNLIDTHYQSYGNRILNNIQTRLRQIIAEQGCDTRKGLCKGWGDDKSRFFVRVLNCDNIKNSCGVSTDQVISESESLQQARSKSDKIVTAGEIQLAFPDLFKGLHQINKSYPSAAQLNKRLLPHEATNRKSAYVLLVTVLKIEGVWQTMSGYLTWVYEDDPYQLTPRVIDRMSEDCLHYLNGKVYPRKKSQVLILHSCTKEKTESVFRDTACIFKEAIRWNGQNKSQLRDWLSEIDYKLVELNPTFRGWAAIVKNTDCILWKFHDLELIPYHPDKQMDLEIHATPYMPNFIKNNAANFQSGPEEKQEVGEKKKEVAK